jgi:3-oxoacyl-[acyl-carrier-protein] synthase-3
MRSNTLPPDLAPIAREATRNGNMRSPARTSRILGLGHHVPPEVVPNGPIAERIGVDDAWIVKRTGIKSRRRALPDEKLTDYAVFAGRRALQDAGVDPRDVDLVLVATMTPDDITPNAAPVVANALGAENAGAVDIGAACTGWLAALRLAAGQVETGRADRVLVIGAELLTRITDFDDPKTAMLFGDGAGAVLVGADGEGDIGPIVMAADGSLADRITASHDDRVLQMDGHSTYQVAVRLPPGERADHQRRRAAARPRARPRRRLRRAHGQHVRRVDPAHAVAAARGRAPAPGPEGPARRHRRGLHLGRRRHRMGRRLSGSAS